MAAELRRSVREHDAAKLGLEGCHVQPLDAAADLTDMIASKNLLGGGDMDRLYPRGDRALRALHACETAWRIAL